MHIKDHVKTIVYIHCTLDTKLGSHESEKNLKEEDTELESEESKKEEDRKVQNEEDAR